MIYDINISTTSGAVAIPPPGVEETARRPSLTAETTHALGQDTIGIVPRGSDQSTAGDRDCAAIGGRTAPTAARRDPAPATASASVTPHTLSPDAIGAGFPGCNIPISRDGSAPTQTAVAAGGAR